MTFRGAIPSAITILNLASGTLAIILLDLFWSPILILLAAVFDLFDGAAARLLNAESEFGKELDSLCDMISFGVAPACVYYLLVPNETYWLITIPVIYTIAAAIRLATFNTLPKSDEFRGLASPPAALFIIGLALAVYHGEPIITTIIETTSGYVILGLLPAMAMISKRRMFSFKGIGDAQTRWWFIILAISVVAVAIYDYRLAVPAAILLYVIFAELRNLLS